MDMDRAFQDPFAALAISLEKILNYCAIVFHGLLKLCQILIGLLASVIGSCLFSANNGFCEAVFKHRTLLFVITVVYIIVISVVYYTNGIRPAYGEKLGRPYPTAIEQADGVD